MELISSIIVIGLFIIIIVNLLVNIKYKLLLIKKISRSGSASRVETEKKYNDIKQKIVEALHQADVKKIYPQKDGYVHTNMGYMPVDDYNDIMNDIE